jgi:pyruvate/2-oxoglutarate dehydrogenase complex dihydrolipoamide dehydrogenase (E3) component
MATPVDAVVVGLGPGGELVAGRLAAAGLEVVAIEDRHVGGECPYWGCIPSKAMIRSSDVLGEARRAPDLAGAVDVHPDWNIVVDRVREVTATWDDSAAVKRLEDMGCRVVHGRGTVVGAGRVEVDGETYEARTAIVLNPGTTPSIPPIDGLVDTPYWTNREALEASRLPSSMVVLGGGAVGVELAQAYARFGCEVSVVEAGPCLLALEEPEAGRLLSDVFGHDGIRVSSNAKAESVAHDGSVFSVTLSSGDTLTGEALLVATGRTAQLRDLGLDSVGVDGSGRFLDVDERLRLTDGIWAIGDATGKGAFTHVSMYQAAIAARDILGEEGPGADYRALPRVTFTDPEIGAVGMTEKQARDAGLNVRMGCTDLPSSSRGYVHGAGNDGFVKVVGDADRGVLVGATSAGPYGGEVLGALAVAVRAEVPVATLRHSMWAYPTFHRAIEAALTALDS